MTQGSKETGWHVVVVGGSFAGLGAAYTLRQALRPEDRVTVVSSSEQFVFAPSLVWAALGRPRVHSTFALEPALQAKGIDFLPSPPLSVGSTLPVASSRPMTARCAMTAW